MAGALALRDIPVCDEQGRLLFHCDEKTARSILSRHAADLTRDAEGPKLWARPRELYEGPDHGLRWLAGGRHWPSAFDVIAGKQRRSILRRCLEALTRPQREIVRLRYQRELKFRQIALVLEVTEEAAVQMHQRLLNTLREQLAAEGVAKLEHIL